MLTTPTNAFRHTPVTPVDNPIVPITDNGHTSNLLSVIKSIRSKSENTIQCPSNTIQSVSSTRVTRPVECPSNTIGISYTRPLASLGSKLRST